MFMNLAHRGASSYAPENTMSAFYKGIEMGANGFETDLKKTKDGVILLFHDNVLDRTTNGTGKPVDYTWDHLQQLDAGSWFAPKFKGEKLISFEQFLYFFFSRELIFAIELKDRNIEVDVLELIDRYSAEEKITITSFHYADLVETRKRNETIKLGYLVDQIDSEAIELALAINSGQICPRAESLLPEHVRYCKDNGLEVRAWGIANEQLMNHALRCGVDGMTINFPDKLAGKADPS